MNQTEKAKRFAELHVKGKPLLLYNAWDAGSAKSILAAGAKAIATSSWSVAEAQGYRDGEAIPIELAERIVERIAATIEGPVTVDFEGGYSEDDGELADNISRLVDTGVIGINFEDRVVKGSGLYSVDRQARRVAAIRKAAERNVPGLVDDALIGRICERVSLPVNIMVMEGVPSNVRLSELGVARISYGPIPYILAMKALEQEARTTLREALVRLEG